MLLEIDDNKTISELQEKFNECFPGLFICFFNKPHHWNGESPIQLQIESTAKIGEIRHKHDPGIMNIKSWDKAGKIERDFRKLFGLNVQVFYYRNNRLVQTTETDDLTLKELSELSK